MMDGLNGYKANLSPAKLKLADIGLELSLANFCHYQISETETTKKSKDLLLEKQLK